MIRKIISFVVSIVLIGAMTTMMAMALNDQSRELTGETKDALSNDSAGTKCRVVGESITVVGTLRTVGGKYVLEEINGPTNPMMMRPTILNKYNLNGNLISMEKLVNSKISVTGYLTKNGVSDNKGTSGNIKVYYYFEKPEIENKMAEFVSGTIKSIQGEQKYFYVESTNGSKHFLVGDLENPALWVGKNVEVGGKNRNGSSPKVLKGTLIFEASNINDNNQDKKERVEMRGMLSKENNQFYLGAQEHFGGPMGPDSLTRYRLTNNLSFMDKYVGKYIRVTGLLETTKDSEIKVYFYNEAPEIENAMAEIASGVVKTIDGEEKYYYLVTASNKKIFMNVDSVDIKGLVGKKVQITGKSRKGSSPLVLKGEDVFSVGSVSTSTIYPQPLPFPEPIPSPEPSPIPSNDDFNNNFSKWFMSIFSSFFSLLMLSFLKF